MGSIFTDNYQRVLSRLLTSSSPRAIPNKGAEQKNKEFHSILAHVEIDSAKKTTDVARVPKNVDTLEQLSTYEPPTPEQLNPKPIVAPRPRATLGNLIGDVALHQLEDLDQTNKTVEQKGTTPTTPQIVETKTIEESTTPQISEVESTNISEIKQIITSAGLYHGIDPSLGLAVAKIESAFNPSAVSKDGHYSKGVFQLLDSTASDMKRMSGMKEAYDPFNPRINSYLGIGHLRRLHNIFSTDTKLTNSVKTVAAKSADDLEKLAVAAYNTGEGNVAKAQLRALNAGRDPGEYSSIEEYLPEITRSYVQKVQSAKDEYIQKSLSFNLG